MAVIYQEKSGLFTLQTKTTTYQMKVDKYGVLLHTYYGPKTDASDYSYLIMPADRGYSGQPGDVQDERTYSLDFYPREYPVYGNGDYRIVGMKANLKGQVPALDLRYHSSRVMKGKYRLEGLPSMFAEEGEDGVDTLEVVLKDRYEDLYVHLLYGVYEEDDVITRAVRVENCTGQAVELKRVMSMSVDFTERGFELVHFYGKHAMERQMERQALPHGITEISSRRGTSSHHHNPFVVLTRKDTTEDHGECCGFAFVYSGSFKAQIEVDQIHQTRLTMGINDEEFCWKLEDQERFTAPEVCMVYSEEGFTGMSRRFQKAFYRRLIRSPWKDRMRPILVNNWEATYFDFDREKLMKIARQASELGLDMLVLDDGWFGKRNNDNCGLGDWVVNEDKLGCSMKELVQEVNDLGLSFGLWFEPEMVSEDSDLYREHPDFAFQIPGRSPVRSRNQLVLDISRKDVREYVEERMFRVLDEANIVYVKWDMNRSIENVYSALLPEGSQGEILHRYVLGLYEMMEHLLERYPNLLLEGCSGGGGRFDAGMLYYAPQIWCSDNTDAVERLKIQYGTSFAYPMSSISAHVSVCPNHQNGRVTPFKTRGICAMQGAFGYELDLSKLSDEDKEEVRRQVKFYRENYQVIQSGDYYRITSPWENHDVTAWSYVAQDASKAILAAVFTDLHGNPVAERVRWRGLDEKAVYEIDGREYTGAALMHGGYLLPVPQCSYDSCMLVAVRK